MQNLMTSIWNSIEAPTLGLLGGALFIYVIAFVADHLL